MRVISAQGKYLTACRAARSKQLHTTAVSFCLEKGQTEQIYLDCLTYQVLGNVVPTQMSILVYFILFDPSAPTQIMALSFLHPSILSSAFLWAEVGTAWLGSIAMPCHLGPSRLFFIFFAV